MSLVVSCELSRLHMQRPAGPAVYAAYVLDLLTQAGVQLVAGRDAARADVVLSLDGRFRAGRGQRIVTAVHDLGHLLARRGYGPGEWLRQNWRVASAVRRSDHLLAPSEAVRHGLDRYLRTPDRRITVLEAPVRACFRRQPREAVDRLRAELVLPPRYFLFVGSRARRKNLGLLSEAWRAAAPRLGPDVGLVLAGPPGPGVPGARDLGYVALERLPALLSGAVAWVNPSFYEGSAIGVLEALACGTPALAAGTGAQPRAVGSAGLILGTNDAGGWTEAMVVLATDADVRARLAAAAIRAGTEVRGPGPGWPTLARALTAAGAET